MASLKTFRLDWSGLICLNLVQYILKGNFGIDSNDDNILHELLKVYDEKTIYYIPAVNRTTIIFQFANTK